MSSFMLEQHKVALSQAAQLEQPERRNLLYQLYQKAFELWQGHDVNDAAVTKRRTATALNVTAVVTDNHTGVFVQLSGHQADPAKLALTAGQFFVVEGKYDTGTGCRVWQV